MTERAKGRRNWKLIAWSIVVLLVVFGVLNLLKLWPPSIDNISRSLNIEIHVNVDGEDLVISKRLTCINKYTFDFVQGGHRVWKVDSNVLNYIHPDGWGMRFTLRLFKHCDTSVDEKIWLGEQGFPSIHILDDAHTPQSVEYYGAYTNVSRHNSVGGRLDTENSYMTVKRSLAFRPKPRTDRVDMGSIMTARERSGKYSKLSNECVGSLYSMLVWTVLPAAVQSYGLAEMEFLPVEGSDLRMILPSKPFMQSPGNMQQYTDIDPLPPYASEFRDMRYDRDNSVWVVSDERKNVLVLSARQNRKPDSTAELFRRMPVFEIDGVIVSYEHKTSPRWITKWLYNQKTRRAWVIENQYIMTNECWLGSK